MRSEKMVRRLYFTGAAGACSYNLKKRGDRKRLALGKKHKTLSEYN
jgi:hypothetical protein